MRELVLAAVAVRDGDGEEVLGALYDVATFEELYRIGRGVAARTWGAFREALGAELFAEVTEHWDCVLLDPEGPPLDPVALGFDSDGPDFDQWLADHSVSPDDPFDAMEMPGYNEGDLPDCFNRALENLPRGVVERFGERYDTVHNGSAYLFLVEAANALAASLAEHGFRIVQVEADPSWVYGASGAGEVRAHGG